LILDGALIPVAVIAKVSSEERKTPSKTAVEAVAKTPESASETVKAEAVKTEGAKAAAVKAEAVKAKAAEAVKACQRRNGPDGWKSEAARESRARRAASASTKSASASAKSIGVLAGAAGGTVLSATGEPHLKIRSETRLDFLLLADWKVK